MKGKTISFYSVSVQLCYKSKGYLDNRALVTCTNSKELQAKFHLITAFEIWNKKWKTNRHELLPELMCMINIYFIKINITFDFIYNLKQGWSTRSSLATLKYIHYRS